MNYFTLLFAALLAATPAFAGPGAHGPNGEHLDSANGPASASSAPMVETFTESFELLGRLSGGELSVLVDRYETNEPVLNGSLEVQYKNLKAKAKFHPDAGDYAIDDAKFLAAISKPGKHPLLFTLIAGDESDLLEGTLNVTVPTDEHGHEHGAYRPWQIAGVSLVAIVLAAFALRRHRQRKEN